jgi:hypothetical protein
MSLVHEESYRGFDLIATIAMCVIIRQDDGMAVKHVVSLHQAKEWVDEYWEDGEEGSN